MLVGSYFYDQVMSKTVLIILKFTKPEVDYIYVIYHCGVYIDGCIINASREE